MYSYIMWYPETNDPQFLNKLYSKMEFRENTQKKTGIYLEPYQEFVRKFIRPGTPYKSLMLYWDLGSGKSLGSLSILENFRNLVGEENGLEKFLVITKNNALQQTYREEILKDPYDVFYGNIRTRSRNSDPETIKLTKKKIDNKYEFVNYDEFVNKVLGKNVSSDFSSRKFRQNSSETLEYFDNRIIVVDEVQNITGNNRYFALMRVLQASKNIRLIILSATPIVDTVKELVYISNLLNFDNPLFDIKDETESLDNSSVKNTLAKQFNNLYKTKILSKIEIPELSIIQEEDDINLSFRNLSVFTDKGQEILLKSLRGKVSYVPFNPDNFPEKIRIGTSLTRYKGSIKVVNCEMSDYQEKAYIYALSKKTAFYLFASEALVMSYESNTPKGMTSKTNLKNTNLKMPGLKKYSCKLYEILKNSEKARGSVFLYSNNVETSGTELIETVIKANDFKKYTSSNSKDKSLDYKRFIRYTSELGDRDRTIIKNVINSKENIDGKIIKFIIGSPMISEGVSFKNISQVHILEPYWNITRTLQAEGRSVRNYSHIDLPLDQRKVEIYWYVATSKNGKDTLDQLKYKLCEKKDRINKKIQRKIKEISIDCFNFKNINSNKGSKGVDYSQECDYTKCDYSCGLINVNSLSYNFESLDSDTYTDKTDPQEIRWAKDLIKSLFTKSQIWDIDSIVDNLSNNLINKYNIYFALDNLLSKEDLFFVKNKGTGRIVYSDKYYRFKPVEYSITNDRDISKYIIQKTPTIKKIKPMRNKGIVKNKIELLNNFMDNKDISLFGIIENEKFKIVDKKNMKKNGNGRDQTRGRTCNTLDKIDIVSLARKLNVDINAHQSKDDICDIIRKYMETNKLLLII